jgi:AcrR family transcriptional regulator
LGVRAPSLYHHYPNKAALLEDVARNLLLEIVPPDPTTTTEWREYLVQFSIACRRVILQHPNAGPLLLLYFPRYILLAAYENFMMILQAPSAIHLMILEGMEKLTYGSALFAAAARSRGLEPFPPFDAAKFPNLAQAIRTNAYHDDEALFAETLRSFFRGIQLDAVEEPSKVRSRRSKSEKVVAT